MSDGREYEFELEDKPKMASKRRRNRRDFYVSGFTLQRVLIICILAAILFALAVGDSWMAAHASVRRAAVPQICNDNIVLRGHILRVDIIKGKPLALAELSFHVYCVPKKGEFDMRLQEFRPRDDEWLTKGAAVKKNVADTVPGENFTMRRIFACSGDLSWRIRFWISPGEADNGTPWPPETLFFPHKAGKQLDCDNA